MQISTLHPASRAVGFEGGTAKMPPRNLVDSGFEAGRSEAPPTPLARHPSLNIGQVRPPDSSTTHSSHALLERLDQCNGLEGYQVYIKDAKEEANWRSRRRRTAEKKEKQRIEHYNRMMPVQGQISAALDGAVWKAGAAVPLSCLDRKWIEQPRQSVQINHPKNLPEENSLGPQEEILTNF